MNCSAYRDWLSAYIDGALEPAKRAGLEAHLQACAGCRQEHEALKAMVQALHTLPKPHAPDLLPGIHRRLMPEPWWQSFTAPWPASLPWHGLALATTALLVLLIARPRSIGNSSDRMLLAKSKTEFVSEEEVLRSHELADSSAANGRLKQSVDDFTPAELPDSGFYKRLRVAEVPSKREAFLGSDVPVMDIQAQPAGPLGASVELASAGGYRVAALPRASLRQSAFPESASALGVEGRIFNQLAGSLALGEAAKEMIVAQRIDQGRANSVVNNEVQGSSESEPSFNAPSLLQLRWQVSQVDEAVARVSAWVDQHQGFVTRTAPNHLSVMLPASEAGAFLQAFPSDAPPQSDIDASAAWVTISLELIPPQ